MSTDEKMKLPITIHEVDHEVVTINLFEDADGVIVRAEDIVNAVNSLDDAVALARECGEAAGRRLFEKLTSDEAKQAIVDRDMAQQKLAELHALANETAFDIEGIEDRGGLRAVQDAVKAIALSAAPIAERWVSAERVQRMDDEFGKMAEKVVVANARASAAEARVAELETTLGYYSDEARGECTDAYRDLVTRAEKAEARLRELEAPKEDEDGKPYNGHLYSTDPDCKHKVVHATGGGVRCTKCSGWFCY